MADSVWAMLAALSPAERAFLASPPGEMEARLPPAGFHAAAVWTSTETCSRELFCVIFQGTPLAVGPADMPGAALAMDMAHLVRWGAGLSPCRLVWFFCVAYGYRRGRRFAPTT